MNGTPETLMLADFFDRVSGAQLIPLVAIGGGLFIAVVSIVMSTIRSTVRAMERERTKREIAAYIAEGSMTPEQGERLIRADMPHWERGDKAKGGCC